MQEFYRKQGDGFECCWFPGDGAGGGFIEILDVSEAAFELLQKPELGQLRFRSKTEDHAIWHASLWPLMEADDEFIYYVGQNGQVVALSIEDEDEERYGVTVLAASIDAWIKYSSGRGLSFVHRSMALPVRLMTRV